MVDVKRGSSTVGRIWAVVNGEIRILRERYFKTGYQADEHGLISAKWI